MSFIDRTDERRCFVDCGQRKVIAITGCSTYGSIYVGNYCKSPNCKNCREREANFLKLMQEEVQKQINNLENGE